MHGRTIILGRQNGQWSLRNLQWPESILRAIEEFQKGQPPCVELWEPISLQAEPHKVSQLCCGVRETTLDLVQSYVKVLQIFYAVEIIRNRAGGSRWISWDRGYMRRHAHAQIHSLTHAHIHSLTHAHQHIHTHPLVMTKIVHELPPCSLILSSSSFCFYSKQDV